MQAGSNNKYNGDACYTACVLLDSVSIYHMHVLLLFVTLVCHALPCQ